MGTQQVSVWVPIVVGIIGLIGIIVGQLINARREDHRWKRQMQQDEYKRRIDRTFDVYAQMATVLFKWEGLVRRLEVTPEESEEPGNLKALHTEFTTISREADEVMGRLRLVGSGSVVRAAVDAWIEFEDKRDFFSEPELWHSREDTVKDNIFETLDMVNRRFIEHARREFTPTMALQL